MSFSGYRELSEKFLSARSLMRTHRYLNGRYMLMVYGEQMWRIVCLSMSIFLSLTMAASAAPVHKRPAHWHGYGFLPGYHQPLNNSLPLYAQKDAIRRLSRERRPWYIDPVPRYYGYDGELHYVGRPGFYRGQYNGGSFGPCWTRTPIGPIWNCG